MTILPVLLEGGLFGVLIALFSFLSTLFGFLSFVFPGI